VSPVDSFAANGELGLICLSHPRGQPQLHTLIESTAGIFGDIQGIAGRDLAEISALGDTLLLEESVE
jgi:hypothetical protein